MEQKLTPAEIIADLKSRGERNIRFNEDGFIYSTHGKNTHNTWVIIEGELKCVDCKTNYDYSL